MISAGSSLGDQIRFYRVNNTIASPSALALNDTIGFLGWFGYNGTQSVMGSEIVGVVSQNWTGSVNGAQVQIKATPNGANATETEALFQGGVLFGTSGSPQGVGTVNAIGGYWSNGVEVIDPSQAATFAGGLTATIALSSSALNYACYNASTHVFTYDNSSTCLVSSLRFKHDVRPIDDAIGTVMRLDPIDFVYNDQSNQPGRQMGLSAESVAAAAPSLALFDREGRPEKVKYIEVIGLLTAAVQEQQHEIKKLEAIVHH